jgi:hypothetical protein
MKLTQNPLFITYYLKRDTSALEVICRGCEELVFFDYDLPSYIKGMIKLDGDYILVLDPNIYFREHQSKLNNLTCIFVFEHVYEYRNCRTSIIIEDIDEIMNFAAGTYSDSSCAAPKTFNMSFIVDVLKKVKLRSFSLIHKNYLKYTKRGSIS